MLFKRKVPIIYLVFTAALASAATFSAFFLINKSTANNAGDNNSEVSENENYGNYYINNYKGEFKYINPILSVEPVNESEKFTSLRENIEQFINKEKEGGLLSSASVYLMDFTKGEWTSVNRKERYDPGSLLKVGVLMAYLKMAESDHTLLEKEVIYHGQKGFSFPVEYYRSDTVIEGRKYKISDLLACMIRYSDNRATLFLEDHMDTTIFKKEFTDLGITEPRFEFPSFRLNVKEYSMMFKALYNAGYLKKWSSERALALLTESAFKNGLLKELPPTIVAAHKYGEQGNETMHELHESGIIYLANKSYLITVMTKGTDWDKLSAVIGHISRIVYDDMVARGNTSY